MSHCIIVAEKMEPKLFSSEMNRVKLLEHKIPFCNCGCVPCL